MSSSREIVTLQFGNYSNYVGAHWWNTQESTFNYDPDGAPSEIDPDVLYREGLDFKGHVTYTPRLLLVDLQQSLLHLPEQGTLYNDSAGIASQTDETKIINAAKSIVWDQSAIEIVQKVAAPKPEFQQDLDKEGLDIEMKDYQFCEKVKSWTDFLYSRYHPRTINIIKDYKLCEEKETFDSFSNGSRAWGTEQFEHEFSDKIRQYLEECNSCQGFQTIFDCTNGFAGLSLKCMEHVQDEYGYSNLAVPVFAPKSVLFENADEAMTDSIRTVNIALSYCKLIEQSSMIVPLSTIDRAWRQLGSSRTIPFVNYNNSNLYQTSAILASFLDTISLRYRVRDPCHSSSLPSFCADLTNYGRKLTSAAISFPFLMRSDQDLIDTLDKYEKNIFTQLSPNSEIGTDYVVQSMCVRGIPTTRLKKPLEFAQHQMKMAAYKCESVSDMFQLYFQCTNHASMAHVSAVQSPLSVKVPFPSEIFDLRFNSKGFLMDVLRSNNDKVMSVPTVASVQCSGDLANTIESLHREASRIKIAKLHRFKETGLEPDDYLEVLESLLQFKDNYEDNFQL